MPQLDTSTFTSQLFWLCICFFSMLFIMSHFFIPRIADILEQRQRKIDSYLGRAQKVKEKAEASLKKYHQALDEANRQASLSLEQTQKDINSLIDKKQSDLHSKLLQKVQKGEEEINATKKEALQQITQVSEELSLDILHKIGITNITKNDIKNALKSHKVN